MYEVAEEPETNDIKSQKDMDLDEWLKEQKKQLDLEALSNRAQKEGRFTDF